ncbi:MAG: hypothetical protein Q9170_002293 [Blastenia crenularia]
MSVFTVTAIANQPEIFHYGKLAGVGFCQDMEIDQDMPRPVDAPSDTMDTSLEPEQQPNVQNQPVSTAHNHALPAKPPVVQEPSLATESASVAEVVTQTSGQLGKASISGYQYLKLTQVLWIARKPARTPYLQQDLLSLFGLKPLVDTVARTDANTGEKINKMRKSYEGKVKTFGLAGRNRHVKQSEQRSMGLLETTQWPAEEWHNQKVHGRDVRDGLPQATLLKLQDAMSMRRGEVPNTPDHDWDDLLGNEKTKPPGSVQVESGKLIRQGSAARMNGQPNGIRRRSEKMSITEANRPKRTGKRRRYDDHSFEGYGEGYDDDNEVFRDQDDISSDEARRRGGGLKKRRKVVSQTSHH